MAGIGSVLQLAARVPEQVWRPTVGFGSRLASLRPPRAVRQWQLNVATATGTRPDAALTRAGLDSWGRNLFESLQVSTWSSERVMSTVLISPEERSRLKDAHATTGAVVALPHMGSWDVAGAWACLEGMPVASVSEQLDPADFRVFLEARERLGITVYGHREPDLTSRLIDDLHRGCLVALLSDRDFSRSSVPAQWPTPDGPVEVSMPPGPARIARETGATLLGMSTHTEGGKLRLVVSEPIAPVAGDDGVATMMQGVCDFFASQVAAHPADWHMLQPFFRDVRA